MVVWPLLPTFWAKLQGKTEVALSIRSGCEGVRLEFDGRPIVKSKSGYTYLYEKEGWHTISEHIEGQSTNLAVWIRPSDNYVSIHCRPLKVGE